MRQSGFDDVQRKGQAAGQLAGSRGTDGIHPASKNAGGFDSGVECEFKALRRGPKAAGRFGFTPAFDRAGTTGPR